MRPASKTSRLAGLLVWITLTAASATYIPWNGHGPVADVSSASGGTSNNVEQSSPERHRRQKPVFRNDAVRLRLIFCHIHISYLLHLCMGTSGTLLLYIIVDHLRAFVY